VAVLTRSPVARAVGLAVRVFRPEVRVFALDEIEAALEYLDVPASERATLLRLLDELKAELHLPR
jgi:hypothetical protein